MTRRNIWLSFFVSWSLIHVLGCGAGAVDKKFVGVWQWRASKSVFLRQAMGGRSFGDLGLTLKSDHNYAIPQFGSYGTWAYESENIILTPKESPSPFLTFTRFLGNASHGAATLSVTSGPKPSLVLLVPNQRRLLMFER